MTSSIKPDTRLPPSSDSRLVSICRECCRRWIARRRLSNRHLLGSRWHRLTTLGNMSQTEPSRVVPGRCCHASSRNCHIVTVSYRYYGGGGGNLQLFVRSVLYDEKLVAGVDLHIGKLYVIPQSHGAPWTRWRLRDCQKRGRGGVTAFTDQYYSRRRAVVQPSRNFPSHRGVTEASPKN